MEESRKIISELSFGKEATDKIELFENGLKVIENKYSQYFSNRESPNEFEKNDKLHNHFITLTDKFGIRFNFKDESDLDEKIKNECNQLFNNTFN